ncbi:MAG: DEAD/DEAH box helicase family protein [Veillonellaceae bacterium]|nr:DEAD/DEAH box helicase family protein [Veillonellaceae bacterium]
MASNFDYLLDKKGYSEFAQAAVEAEKALAISPASVAIHARKALELGVKFIYSVEPSLTIPYKDNLSALIHNYCFKDMIGLDLFHLIKFIVRLGNVAVHSGSPVQAEDAILSLRNLHSFCDWIDYSYSEDYQQVEFDVNILPKPASESQNKQQLQKMADALDKKSQSLEELKKLNEDLMNQLQELKQVNIQQRVFQVDEISEAETRNRYIDLALMEAGWRIAGAQVKLPNCYTEVPVAGMPNNSGNGYVDYVLYGQDQMPLAVVEAKKTSVDAMAGSYQAKLYADCLGKQYGRRPLIFTTNGFEIFYTNDFRQEARRQISGFLTQDELQLEMERRRTRKPLYHIEIDENITNRPYQKQAVITACEEIENHHRKLLIVQATGTGKTRVSISLVDVLLKHNYVKNILFLADRTALVRQAMRNYVDLLPNLTCCNLTENKEDPQQCRMIFSTYPTIMNAIDSNRLKDGRRLFTPGHFDLIILDEAHRSVYNKYQDIFQYFDGMLLGLTATPKSEIDKDTYGVFDLEKGNPTFAYELEQAVEEGYLVNYTTLEYKDAIMENGVHYDELSEEDKKHFEDTFAEDPTISVTKKVPNTAVNKWLFNQDTIDNMLKELMDKGLKVSGGDVLGKTIIFARSSLHAKAIVERFNKLFPEYGGEFIKQIDYSIKYADVLLDDFGTRDKYPQIAVSVDMLDTGIDVPEILNLVFYKKVKSYAKFWQMIGRGTRLCKNLLGKGQDKDKFLILDFCGNFDYFRVNTNGQDNGKQVGLTERIFNTQVEICRCLQAGEYTQQKEYVDFRQNLVEMLCHEVICLNDDSFRVKLRRKYVDIYRQMENWQDLDTSKIADIKQNIAPIVPVADKDELARRFDYTMYSIILGTLNQTNINRFAVMVTTSCQKLAGKYTIPQVAAQRQLIDRIIQDGYWAEADIFAFDQAREALRELMQFLDSEIQSIYYTHFDDELVNISVGEPLGGGFGLKPYRERVKSYLHEHEDTLAVYKLRNNKQMTTTDLAVLEKILWQDLGSKEDYVKTYGEKPVGMLVRELLGMDQQAVNEAFSEFITDSSLNSRQIDFVKMIISYIVKNGNIVDVKSTFSQQPFTEFAGGIGNLFRDNMLVVQRIMGKVSDIRKNSQEII